ncbi:MAG TPA: DUF72 domain-containing protein [Acidobacteriaceae bacterium]|nr:DUF72 domain-containing protein [Acidobacteriaceae bacterium]
MVYIGTAGWTIPKQHAALASGQGTHLERYARLFNCVEINSSFHRPHRASTWQRWADATPRDFRFSVKLPKTITHQQKLRGDTSALDTFLAEVSALKEKLGVLLVQLPPKLAYEDCPATEFFEFLRDRFACAIALEPRHASWFTAEAEELLIEHKIARVAADPRRHGPADANHIATPGGWSGLAYFRLHGSPRTYYSPYEPITLAHIAEAVQRLPAKASPWIIFDNTAAGHAFANAADLKQLFIGSDNTTRQKAKQRP